MATHKKQFESAFNGLICAGVSKQWKYLKCNFKEIIA
ncbi:hypothetical protein SAMN05444274_104211 [Mariniphaga anaerophila]|uniref:Uncharacterized protein n=1 Tax=Mariniphaga anaerophila TaxID=1484053 RepID=A0A1M5A6U8_9BACT|nr:hypothetical protein SAMN05444274_104211 [Mariniphaga anaerophila]